MAAIFIKSICYRQNAPPVPDDGLLKVLKPAPKGTIVQETDRTPCYLSNNLASEANKTGPDWMADLRGEGIFMPGLQKNNNGESTSWNARHINGVECFRASNLVHQFRRHSHGEYTIGVIEKGFGDNDYRGSVFHLSPGKIVVMNPEEAHTGCVVNRQPWSYRMFYISQETFRQVLPEKGPMPFFRGLCLEDRKWFKKLRALHRLLEKNGDALEQQISFVEIFMDFTHAHGKSPTLVAPGNEPKAIRMIKDYLQANYRQNISLDDLSRLTQLSRAYLIRSFRRWVGIPPYAYLIQTRINYAKNLLAKREPVAQVALETGFSDQSHLTRHFKSITGITPKQYALGHCS